MILRDLFKPKWFCGSICSKLLVISWMLEKQCDGRCLQGVSKVENLPPANVILQHTKGAQLMLHSWVISREKQNKMSSTASVCFSLSRTWGLYIEKIVFSKSSLSPLSKLKASGYTGIYIQYSFLWHAFKERKQAAVFLGMYQNSLVTEAVGPSGNHLELAAGPSTIVHIRVFFLKIECFPIKN